MGREANRPDEGVGEHLFNVGKLLQEHFAATQKAAIFVPEFRFR
jgi:hypothetical protein